MVSLVTFLFRYGGSRQRAKIRIAEAHLGISDEAMPAGKPWTPARMHHPSPRYFSANPPAY